MATGTGRWFGKALIALANKEVDLLDDAIKIMLTTSSFTPDQDVNDYKDDVTSEVVGTGYTATGATLANDTLTYTAGTNVLKYDADDVTWPNSSITARNAVIYDSTPATDATRPLLGYIVFSGDVTTDAGTFQITFDSAGVLTATAS